MGYVNEVRQLMGQNQTLARENQHLIIQLEEIEAQKSLAEKYKNELIKKEEAIGNMQLKLEQSSKRYQLKIEQVKN